MGSQSPNATGNGSTLFFEPGLTHGHRGALWHSTADGRGAEAMHG